MPARRWVICYGWQAWPVEWRTGRRTQFPRPPGAPGGAARRQPGGGARDLEHFSPQQLTLRFERDGRRPLLATSGSRWRAYGRYHQSLCQDDDWSERLLARDFAQAYEEQVRLISTPLHRAPG